MMTRHVVSGEGWRLGWSPNADHFRGLVAGQYWAIELTTAEFQDFCRAAQKLKAEMTAMASLLMDEERITCEQETASIWVEAEGIPSSYSLRFILLAGRKAEGAWPAAAAAELTSAIARPPFSQISPT